MQGKVTDKKKNVPRRRDKKNIAADNYTAVKNFRAATLYSSLLGPGGIHILLIISTRWYILCAATSSGTMTKHRFRKKVIELHTTLKQACNEFWKPQI